MADDTRLNQNTTVGDLIALDELTTINGVAATAGLKVQRVKPGYGLDGLFTDVSFSTPFPVMALANGVISTVNSTAVALGIGGIFTGPAEETTDYADIRITVFADQPSATDGLQIQQSSNGTAWDISDNYTLPVATGRPFSVAASARFFRIVYTNGATAQTAFRLQTKFYKGYTKGASVRPQDGRSRENDMEEVIGYAMHFDGTNWNMQRGSIANGLAVDVTRVLGSVAVTGTFFQATQAVSGTFFQTTQPVSGAFFQATQPVSGAFFQATQPVSAASLPLPAGAATEATLTNHTQRFQVATTLTAVSLANTAVTLTLPAVAGQFHYITRIEIVRVATAALGGTAVLTYTSTNIPGAWARSAGNAMAAGGTVKDVDEALENAIKSTTVNTATTIVAPAAGAAVLTRITAYYYAAA